MPDVFTNKSSTPPPKGGTVGLFSTCIRYPKNFRLHTQEEGEVIILFLRSHIITLFGAVFFFSLLLFVPPLLSLLNATFSIVFPFLTPSLAFFFTLFYYAFITSMLFMQFLRWFYNIFIVTNKRVIDIDYQGVGLHNVASTRLTSIEDVLYSQAGFLSSFLHFGTVQVITPTDEKNFEAIAVPHPDRVVEIINSLLGKEKRHGPSH